MSNTPDSQSLNAIATASSKPFLQPVNKPVILHCDFFDEGFGGIKHRAEQLGELLACVGSPVVEVKVNPASVSKLMGLTYGLRHLWIRGYRMPHRFTLVGRYGRRLVAFVNAFRAYPPGSCVVWALSNDFVVPYAARICGLPIIAVPMTFESLIPWTHDVLGGGTKWDKLRFEVEHLSVAQSVFCISAEEQWLLAGFGITADRLPYYPASHLTNQLLAIRDRRLNTTPKHILVLSSSNPANISGVRHLANLLSKLPSPAPLPVILVGHGTEQYRDEFDPNVLTIEGSVDSERLDDLMTDAKAFLVYQHFGTGALTRIPESLIAGVPVLCNNIAARSAHHYSGVYTYETSDELARLLIRDLPTPPVPPHPELNEKRLIDAIRSLTTKG